jgi:hypothetical protein
MRLPRFRIRALMVAVAVLGTLPYCWILWGRHSRLLRLAGVNGQREQEFLYAISWCRTTHATNHETEVISIRRFRDPARNGRKNYPELVQRWQQDIEVQTQQMKEDDSMWADTIEQYKQAANHFGRLKKKYLRAARNPWLFVPPDPPAPPAVLPQTITLPRSTGIGPLANKSLRAAHYPSAPVEPDPPEPT